MAETSETTPQARPARLADFDEQLWPVNCAILVLAGLVVGFVVAASDFADPRILFNGYTHLAAIGLMVTLLFAGVRWLHRKMLRRLQLAILLSLIGHFWLAAYLNGHPFPLSFGSATGNRPAAAAQEPDDPMIVPEYHWEQAEQPRVEQAFAAPVATSVPDEKAAPATLEHGEMPSRMPVAEVPNMLPPEAIPDVQEQPDLREFRRAAGRSPGPTELAANEPMDRQSSRPTLPRETAEAPPIAAISSEPRMLESAPTAVERQQGGLSIASTATPASEEPSFAPTRAASAPSPANPLRQDRPMAANIARRADPSQPEPRVPARPGTLARSDRGGMGLPSASLADQPDVDLTASAAGSSAASRIEAESQVAVQRSPTSRAPVGKTAAAAGSAEFGTGSGQRVARSGMPRGRGEGLPSIAPNSSAPRLARTLTGTSIGGVPPAEASSLPSVLAVGGSGETLGPTETASIARSARGAGPPAAGGKADGNLPAGGPLGPVGIAEAGRFARQKRTPPELVSGGIGSGRPSRVERAALGGAPPTDTKADAPVITDIAPHRASRSAEGTAPQASVTRQDPGVAGLPGRFQSTVKQGALDAQGVRGAPLPMSVAQRAAASQPEDGGPGLGPSSSATLPRTRTTTGADLPAAVAPAEQVAVAGAGGVAASPGGAPSSLDVGPADAGPSAAAAIGRLGTAGAPRKTEGPDSLEPSVLELRDALAGGDPGRRAVVPLQIAALPDPDGFALPAAAALLPRGPGESIQMASGSGLDSGTPAIGRTGGHLLIEGTVKEATPAYEQRETPRYRGFGPPDSDGSGGTDESVELGLDFFARLQFPDGHWSLDKLPPGLELEDAGLGQMQSDAAATGLVLLSYLGAGYTHLDDKHRTTMRRGIDWLVKHQRPTGELFTGGTKYARLYSQGIAAMALGEAYGMTQDPELREPAQRAIGFIVQSQDPLRGGWRYEPQKESDTSVSGWQLMALKSAQMAGLEVPVETLRRVNRWLDFAQAPAPAGRYVYNPWNANTPEQREGRQPSLAMTAEAMLMRMYLGQRRNDPRLFPGANYLKNHLPEVGTTDVPQRDCYYWYYATQTMCQMGGDYWTAWNSRLRPLMTTSQERSGDLAGSWHPNQPVPDRWGHAGGRIYVTAMHLLMLEVQQRRLPLFQELGK